MALNLGRYAPSFILKIGGTPQSDLKKAIISLEVDESLDAACMFTFNINEGLDAKTQKFKWLDNKLIDPASGDDVEIYLGYAADGVGSGEAVITGRITALNPSFPSSGTPTLSVQGYDHSYCLQKSIVKDKRTFDKEKSYQDVVMKIAKEQNLSLGQIDNAVNPCEKIIQNAGESDYALLKRLADRIGYEFFIRNKKLYFRKPRDDTNEVLTLKWGRELMSFSPRMSTAKVISKVTVRGHNQKNPSKPIVGVATLSDLGFKEPGAKSGAESAKESETSESEVPVCNEEDAKNIAKALLARANNSLIEGSCECIGIPKIHPGMSVKIEGVGIRFSGRYYIKSVKHSLGDNGYTMSFDVRRGGSGVI
jgi:uncharacterized protein